MSEGVSRVASPSGLLGTCYYRLTRHRVRFLWLRGWELHPVRLSPEDYEPSEPDCRSVPANLDK